jgi:tetratricopeptide (TPR) repeat protein
MTVTRIVTNLACLTVDLCLLLLPAGAWGHPDLDEQLAHVNALIDNSPTNAELWLQRAELYRLHSDFNLAFADIAVAAKLKTGWPDVELERARVFSDTGRTQAALKAAEQVLTSKPSHPEALVIRARCLSRLNRAAEAVADYTAALKLIPKPSPDLFLERARTQAALGHLTDAVAGLDEGLARLGDVVSLQLAAIEYERQDANFDAALARVDKLCSRNQAREMWLALRAEILEQSGRLTDARKVYEEALIDIAKYPAARRGHGMTLQLEQRLRAGLARTERRLALASNQIRKNAP